jgi:hypothetical protein
MSGFITEAINDLDAVVQKAKAYAKTGWLAFEGFMKPLLSEIGHVLVHIAEADLVKLGETAFAGLKNGQGEAEIIAGLKASVKTLLPENISVGETALFGIASAVLSGAKVKLAADPSQNTN